MKKTTKWIGVGGGLLLLGVLSGCSSSQPSRPGIGQLQQGVNLLDVRDPSWGFDAAYVDGTRVIYMESRVGGLKPEIYRQEFPNDPPNEQDMRFVDQNGVTFYLQRGGDTFVDPSWDAELTKAVHNGGQVNPADRELDFNMLPIAAKAAAAALPATFKDHIFHLNNIASELPPSQSPMMQAKVQRISAQPFPTEAAYQNYNYGAYSWFETDKYHGNIAWGVANHSTTRMWDCVAQPGQNCSWVTAICNCNHGRCCGDTSLSYDCNSNNGWFWNATITGETSTTTGVSGACLSGYNWDTPPGHECNSDAAYELWQAKSGSINTSQGGQWSFHWNNGNDYWCSTPSGGGSGDWSTPSCP